MGLLAEAATTVQATTTSTPVAAAVPAQTAPAVAPTPAVPAPTPTPAAAPELPKVVPAAAESAAPNLAELWQQILGSLELPSTRMLLTQQGELVRLDNQRAVVRVAPNWAGMVQSRLPLLEQAAAKVLGQPRQVVLETGEPSQQKQPTQPPIAPPPAPVAAPEQPPASPSPAAVNPTPAAPAPSTKPMAPAAAASPPPAAAVHCGRPKKVRNPQWDPVLLILGAGCAVLHGQSPVDRRSSQLRQLGIVSDEGRPRLS